MGEATTTKVALVTGSGRQRLGNVIAHALAEWGFHVALHYHRSATSAFQTVDQLQAEGTQAAAFAADVGDETEVDRLFDCVLERFGRLDALVTTASIWKTTPLESLTAKDVLDNFRVDALGTLLCARRGGLIMAGQSEGGAIVTLGDWAVRRPYRDHLAYFAAKGTLATLTRALAVELAHRNPRVRVNCIQPGPVLFPPETTEDEQRELIESTLVKDANCPRSVALAVKFFIDNPFVTGVCLPVDGGRSIYAVEATHRQRPM
jgi:pteridine reductase